MAQLSESVRQEIEQLLDRLTWQWGRLLEVEAEIADWDQIDQIVFVEEWTLEEDCLLRLERHVAAGALTPEPLQRYDELRRLVAQNRLIIQRLRAS